MGMSTGAGPSGRRRGVGPMLNVTPLVDVALVVLIIFMVVTPLATKTFWLNIPKAAEDNKPKPASTTDKPLIMTVGQDGVIRLNRQVVSEADLAERLPRMLAATRTKVLHFDADSEAPYGTAVRALDLSRASGAQSIAIVTKPLIP